MSDFTRLPDLASRALGGAVVARQRRVLRGQGEPGAARAAGASAPSSGTRARSTTAGRPAAAARPATTGRSSGSGRPGIVAGVVVDTAFFTGNYPPRASLDGAAVEGHPSLDELSKADWQPLLPPHGPGRQHAQLLPGLLRPAGHPRPAEHPPRRRGRPAAGARHGAARPAAGRRRPVRPGGAGERRPGDRGQQRVLRPAVPADRPRPGPLDGRGLGDRPPPRPAATTGSRCRWPARASSPSPSSTPPTSSATPPAPRRSPASARTARSRCCRAPACSPTPGTGSSSTNAPGVDRVRLDVFPDGGMARLRLWGRPTAAGRAALGRRWFDALPDVQALEVLGSVGVPPQQAGRLVGRPAGAAGTCLRRSPGCWTVPRPERRRRGRPRRGRGERRIGTRGTSRNRRGAHGGSARVGPSSSSGTIWDGPQGP